MANSYQISEMEVLEVGLRWLMLVFSKNIR